VQSWMFAFAGLVVALAIVGLLVAALVKYLRS